MNDFLKELMRLAEELHKSNGFDSLLVVDEMTRLYDKHVSELKLKSTSDMESQFDLLKAYELMLVNSGDLTKEVKPDDIRSFIMVYNYKK